MFETFRQTLAEAQAVKAEVASALSQMQAKPETTKTLKPVPVTTTGSIGWLASKCVIIINFQLYYNIYSHHIMIYIGKNLVNIKCRG